MPKFGFGCSLMSNMTVGGRSLTAIGRLLSIILGTFKEVKNFPIIVDQRIKQLEQKRKTYIWNFYPDIGLPSSMSLESKHHRDENFDRLKILRVIEISVNGVVHGLKSEAFKLPLLTKFVKDHSSMSTLYDAERIATSIIGDRAQSRENHNHDTGEIKIHACEIHRWTNDSEFGRQILNGANCVIVKICTELPENFPVTGEIVNHLLCRGLTLEQEMQVSILT